MAIKPREPDILAVGALHNVEFWRSHRDVERVEVLRRDVDVDGPTIELAFWLRPGAAAEPFSPPILADEPPPREHDLYLGAEDICEGAWFWDRVQGLEHYIFMQDFDPEWWGVQLWLTNPDMLKPAD